MNANLPTSPNEISDQLFQRMPEIRYVAVNQKGHINEMRQNPLHPSYNPPETDRIEELIVNPILLELSARRGNIDMDGSRYVLVRYGTQYQLLFPYREGHLSIGINLEDDPIRIARKVAAILNLKI